MDQNERCRRLVSAIQNLEQTEITELFKLLHSSRCEYTRNNNGIFVNLSWLPEDMLKKIETYVEFCTKSRNEVKRYESLCDVLNKNMNEIAAVDTQDSSHSFTTYASDINKSDKKLPTSKVSSSMRFYLLKKKFSKQVPLTSCVKSDLKHDSYLL